MPDVLGDPQAGADAAERLHLEDRDVGRLEVADPVGVGGAPDRLVRGDRGGDPAAYDGEVLHRGTGLLDVLQPAGGPVELADRGDGRVHVPGAVRVDPDPPAGPEGVAHGLDAGDVGGQR